MVPPVACQFVPKSLALSLQSNYFCWHPATFASFQMDLMSLSLGMGVFECLPLQNFVVVVLLFLLSSGAAPSQTSEILHSQNPSNQPSCVSCFYELWQFYRLFLSLLLFSWLEDSIIYQGILWQIQIGIHAELATDNGQIWFFALIPLFAWCKKLQSVCAMTKNPSLRTNLITHAISFRFKFSFTDIWIHRWNIYIYIYTDFKRQIFNLSCCSNLSLLI